MALIGRAAGIDAWLPTHLLGALDGLVRGSAMGSYVRATGVTLVAGSAALAASLWLAARQEV